MGSFSGHSLLDDEDDDDEQEERRAERILIFASRENLKFLYRSKTWFVDGTFKVRTLFKFVFQLFPSLRSMHVAFLACVLHSQVCPRILSPQGDSSRSQP